MKMKALKLLEKAQLSRKPPKLATLYIVNNWLGVGGVTDRARKASPSAVALCIPALFFMFDCMSNNNNINPPQKIPIIVLNLKHM